MAATIRDGTLIQSSAFEGLDFDSLLDQRDLPEFEDKWIQASEEIESEWKDFGEAETVNPKIDEIRELAFKKCYEYAGTPEICGYVSDDFELFAKASVLSAEIPFLEDMMNIYRSGKIPK